MLAVQTDGHPHLFSYRYKRTMFALTCSWHSVYAHVHRQWGPPNSSAYMKRTKGNLHKTSLNRAAVAQICRTLAVWRSGWQECPSHTAPGKPFSVLSLGLNTISSLSRRQILTVLAFPAGQGGGNRDRWEWCGGLPRELAQTEVARQRNGTPSLALHIISLASFQLLCMPLLFQVRSGASWIRAAHTTTHKQELKTNRQNNNNKQSNWGFWEGVGWGRGIVDSL